MHTLRILRYACDECNVFPHPTLCVTSSHTPRCVFNTSPRPRAVDVTPSLSDRPAGPLYCDAPVYDMLRLDGTMDGRRMMRAARAITDNIALLAPRNADVHQVGEGRGERAPTCPAGVDPAAR